MQKIVLFSLIVMVLLVRPANADAGVGDTDSKILGKLEMLAGQMEELQQVVRDQQTVIQKQAEELSVLKASVEGELYAPPPPTGQPLEKKAFSAMLFESAPWLKGMKQEGDFRLRLENFKFFDKDASFTTNTRDQNRARFRLRYGIEKDIGDDVLVGFRIATGGSDPTSTNETMDDLFNPKNLNLDRAYAIYSPHQLKGYKLIEGITLKKLTVGGGKFNNVFQKYATANVWDSDVNLEGIYETVDLLLYDAPGNKVESTLQFGQMSLDVTAAKNTDSQLFAYQGGVTLTTDAFKEYINLEKPVAVTTALSYYQWVNYFATIAGQLKTNFPGERSPQVLDYYTDIGLTALGKPVKIFGNFTKNTSNSVAANSNTEKPANQDEAYGIGFTYGEAKKPRDWSVSYGFYYLEANATAAAFNDQDFGGPDGTGGTNRKGHKLQLNYKLAKNVTGGFTGFLVTPVHDSSVAARDAFAEKVVRFQTDLVFKF